MNRRPGEIEEGLVHVWSPVLVDARLGFGHGLFGLASFPKKMDTVIELRAQ